MSLIKKIIMLLTFSTFLINFANADSWSTNSFTGVTSGSLGGNSFSCSTNSFTGVTTCN